MLRCRDEAGGAGLEKLLLVVAFVGVVLVGVGFAVLGSLDAAWADTPQAAGLLLLVGLGFLAVIVVVLRRSSKRLQQQIRDRTP